VIIDFSLNSCRQHYLRTLVVVSHSLIVDQGSRRNGVQPNTCSVTQGASASSRRSKTTRSHRLGSHRLGSHRPDSHKPGPGKSRVLSKVKYTVIIMRAEFISSRPGILDRFDRRYQPYDKHRRTQRATAATKLTMTSQYCGETQKLRSNRSMILKGEKNSMVVL
jgi:hypothetical protein